MQCTVSMMRTVYTLECRRVRLHHSVNAIRGMWITNFSAEGSLLKMESLLTMSGLAGSIDFLANMWTPSAYKLCLIV